MNNDLIFEIRKAKIQDSESLYIFKVQVTRETEFLSYGINEYKNTMADEEKKIAEYLNSDNNLLLVSVLNDKVIGSFECTGGKLRRDRHTGEIGIVVGRKYWGNKIANGFYETFLEWVHDKNILKKINLRVRADNYRAVKLYIKWGFQIEGLLRKEQCVNNIYYDHYWMGKVI